MKRKYYTYSAIVRKVTDGDTYKLDIELGFNAWILGRTVRVNGIDAPEKKSDNPREAMLGVEVTQQVKKMLEGKEVTLVSKELDGRGRVLGSIVFEGRDLSKRLLEAKLVRSYDGKKARTPWTEGELNGLIYTKPVDSTNN